MICNYKVYTSFKYTYKVITKLLLYYIVITFSVSGYALTFDSELIDGKLVYGQLADGEKLFVQNNYLNIVKNDKNLFEIHPDKQGRFILGIPQDKSELSVVIQKDNVKKEVSFPVSLRTWDEEFVTGLPPKKVSPNQQDNERIVSESLAMRQARQVSDFNNFPNAWQRPVLEFKRISSQFGSRRILNNVKKQWHSGTDYAAPIGTAITAPAPGKVVYIHPDMFLTGQTVMIDHGFGVFSSYSHMSSINVELNQNVNTGDLIGSIGQTGRATGPHLHFTITWYGVRVNPEDLF